MSNELNSFVVANAALIPCTVRTLRPFFVNGEIKPWCHQGELCDALLYLASRAGLPPPEILVLKETFENLSSSLKNLSAMQDQAPAEITLTSEQQNHNTHANR